MRMLSGSSISTAFPVSSDASYPKICSAAGLTNTMLPVPFVRIIPSVAFSKSEVRCVASMGMGEICGKVGKVEEGGAGDRPPTIHQGMCKIFAIRFQILFDLSFIGQGTAVCGLYLPLHQHHLWYQHFIFQIKMLYHIVIQFFQFSEDDPVACTGTGYWRIVIGQLTKSDNLIGKEAVFVP